jgi:uncharacterized protein (TIGR02001 family)
VLVRARWRATLDRGHLLDRPRWRSAFALWFLFASAEIFAQVSGSASLLSNYRYRGISLSNNDPAAQLAVAYDDASGWYGGAFASTVQIGYPASRELQAVAFGGYARRMPSGLSWEAGADYSAFTGGQSYNYAEVYVGMASENVSTRLYYAPRYFGQEAGVIYGEINASQRLLDRVRLLAHGGVLRNNSERAYGRPADRDVFDASVGVIIDFDQFTAQLSWVGINSLNTPYPARASGSKNGPVLILSLSF